MIGADSLMPSTRFGNHLFLYVYVRSQAKRMNTKFFFPSWDGDQIFELDDRSERVAPAAVKYFYSADPKEVGFDPSAMTVQDNTSVAGYFISWKYFYDKDSVRRWLRFRPEICIESAKQWGEARLRSSIALHVRLGDFRNHPKYYICTRSFYLRALSHLGADRPIMVFSDEPEAARRYLGGRFSHATFVSGTSVAADLYLMSIAYANVISPSTLAWWGAWLNPNERVVAPKEGNIRPGGPVQVTDYYPQDWTQFPAISPFWTYQREEFRVNLLRRFHRIAAKLKLS